MFASAAKEPANRKDHVRARIQNAERDGKAAVDNLNAAAQAAGQEVRDFIETTIDSASEGLSRAKEKISDTKETLSHQISEKPLTWAALLVGAGVLMGAFLRRR